MSLSSNINAGDRAADGVESRYAWLRLAIALLLSTIGGVGMWSVIVVLPLVQVEFGVGRADASLAFTATMIGFGIGGVFIGRLVDRFGILLPVAGASIALGLGYIAAGNAATLWQFAAIQGVLIGVGCAATFAPLMADISHWFTRHRGIAVTISASGNYFAGALWPPILEHFIRAHGWRATHMGVGVFLLAAMLPLAFLLRRPAPSGEISVAEGAAAGARGSLGLSPNALTALLAVAGVACCGAMSMPQVHIVAYCGDLGYGVARGSEMLSLMMACGIVSRIGSGWIADSIGGLPTLLLGSTLQGVALFLYLLSNGLTSLYVISALFGLFQGGIVPSYAIIVREYFPPQQAATRTGIIIMATVAGMAFGGWSSGAIFDATGSYRAAFATGLAWNLLNGSIVLWLLLRRRRPLAFA